MFPMSRGYAAMSRFVFLGFQFCETLARDGGDKNPEAPWSSGATCSSAHVSGV